MTRRSQRIRDEGRAAQAEKTSQGHTKDWNEPGRGRRSAESAGAESHGGGGGGDDKGEKAERENLIREGSLSLAKESGLGPNVMGSVTRSDFI